MGKQVSENEETVTAPRMTRAEAGRLGGRARLQKHGVEGLRAAGRKGVLMCRK